VCVCVCVCRAAATDQSKPVWLGPRRMAAERRASRARPGRPPPPRPPNRGGRIPPSTPHLPRACRSHPRLGALHHGVYSMDALPLCDRHRRPLHLIVNTDESWRPGEHWLSIFCTKDGTVEVADSLALGPPFDARLLIFAKQFGGKIVYNTRALQDLTSVACGLFALSHAHFRAMGLSFETWLARFDSHDLAANTRRVQCDFIDIYANRNRLAPTLPRQTWRMWVARCRSSGGW